MSRPIFSLPAAHESGLSLPPPAHAAERKLRTLTPGQRIVDGRVLYSAAWLDSASGADPEAAQTPSREAVAKAAPLTRGG